jgi:hypothetical protein
MPMKRLFRLSDLLAGVSYILTYFVLFSSCNNAEKSKAANASEVSVQMIDTAKTQTLILELKKLFQVILSDDKEQIADIFTFPLSEEMCSIYVDDSLFNEQFKSNGNKITRAMFLRFYDAISESIQLTQVRNLIHNIPLDGLMQNDTLNYQAYNKLEPCFYSYHIEFSGDILTLRMNMNSNESYQSKTLSKYGIPENSSEICEHDFWWIIRFDGKKLHLQNISGAD